MNKHRDLFRKKPSPYVQLWDALPLIIYIGCMLLILGVLIWCTATVTLSHEYGVI